MPAKRNRPLKLLGQKSPERNGSMRKIQPLLIILEKKTSEQPHTYFWTKRSANSWTEMPLKRNLPLKLLGQKSPERNDGRRKIQPLLIILEMKTSEQPHTYSWTKSSGNNRTKMLLKRNRPLMTE
jgi:hypothetical protein